MKHELHRYELTIREQHLDVFGHVNNAVYMQLFEEARWAVLNAGGMTLERIFQKQIAPIVLGVSMRFTKELKARENVVVETQWKLSGSRVWKILQRVVSNGDIVHAEAEFTGGLMDLKARKIIPADSDWKQALGLE